MSNNELLDQSKLLLNLMLKKLHEMMLDEVNQNSFEMTIQMVNGENPFSDNVLNFARGVFSMAETVSYLTTGSSGTWEAIAKEVVDTLEGSEGKIGAIKALRKLVGCDLKEAKDEVEYFISFKRWNPDFTMKQRKLLFQNLNSK